MPSSPDANPPTPPRHVEPLTRSVERSRGIPSLGSRIGHDDMTGHGAARVGVTDNQANVFTWNGVALTGVLGDTVASALIAAGERIFTIHPTSGEQRGGFCFVGRCSDCLVVVDGQPGVMACVTPLTDGLRVERQVGHGHWGEDGS